MHPALRKGPPLHKTPPIFPLFPQKTFSIFTKKHRPPFHFLLTALRLQGRIAADASPAHTAPAFLVPCSRIVLLDIGGSVGHVSESPHRGVPQGEARARRVAMRYDAIRDAMLTCARHESA